MFCSNCGRQLRNEKSNFCPYCGYKLNEKYNPGCNNVKVGFAPATDIDVTGIFEKNKKNSQKVCFKIKWNERIHLSNIYKIAKDETIYAYVDTGRLFSTIESNGTVLTEKAMYVFPKDEYKERNRVAYRNLYDALLEFDDTSSLGLQILWGSSNKNIQLVAAPFLSANIRGKELYNILKDIQEIYYKKDNEYRLKRDNTCMTLLQECDKKRKSKSKLYSSDIRRLFVLLKDNKWKKSAATILEWNALRECDGSEYQRIQNMCDENVLNKNLVFAELLQDLKNIKYEFTVDDLKKINSNMKSSSNVEFCGKYGEKIRIFALLRGDNLDELDELEKNESADNEKILKSEEYLMLKNYYIHKRMCEYWDKIEKSLNAEFEEREIRKILFKKDGLLFTPIHYALILGRLDIFNLFMKKYEIGSVESSTELKEFDYLHRLDILAGILNLECTDLICMRTSKEINSINKAINGLSRYIRAQERLINTNDYLVTTARKQISMYRRNGNYEKVESLQAHIQKARQNNGNISERIKEAREEIGQLQKELQEAIVRSKEQNKKIVEELKNTTNPFVKKVIDLLKTPEQFYQYISSCYELTILHLCDNFLFIPSVWGIHEDDIFNKDNECEDNDCNNNQSDSQESQKKEDSKDNQYKHANENKTYTTNSKKEKLYGESWFSPGAHTDLKILKTEYRALAKEYHPDHCKLSNATEIFQEIMAERAEIIEHLEE